VRKKSSAKKMATPKDIVRLAQKVEWREVKSPQGDIVEPRTIRQMFDYAAANLKRKKAGKRLHAVAA